MINRFFISGLLILSFFIIAFSCSSDESMMADNTAAINQIKDMASSGTWKITNYMDSGQDETSDFTGYNFTFDDNGTLTATNGTNTYNGTWSITDSGSNDNTNDDIDFNITFTSPSNFQDLSDDWDILSSSTLKIELRDVSGGNGGTDLLTFEKN